MLSMHYRLDNNAEVTEPNLKENEVLKIINS